MQACSCNYCCSRKTISISHSECVSVALIMEDKMLTRHVVLCGLSGSTVFFSHNHKSRTISEKKMIEHKMCFDFLYKLFWNIFHSKKNWVRYDNKCTLVLMWSNRYSCQILMEVVISRQIFEKYVSNLRKIRPVGVELFHAGGRTDMAQVTEVLFSIS
jgi:hypothetical protein